MRSGIRCILWLYKWWKQTASDNKNSQKNWMRIIFCFSWRKIKSVPRYTTTEKLIKMSSLLTLSSLITTDVGTILNGKSFPLNMTHYLYAFKRQYNCDGVQWKQKKYFRFFFVFCSLFIIIRMRNEQKLNGLTLYH